MSCSSSSLDPTRPVHPHEGRRATPCQGGATNTPTILTTSSTTTLLALWPVAPVPGWWVAGSGSPLDWPNRVSQWLADVPGLARRLWHLVAALWWPWLPLAVLVVLAVTVAAWLAYRAAWRRVMAGGYWLSITPPRSVDAGRWDRLWPTLHPLAAAAAGGRWRLIHPPVGFEMYAAAGELKAGLWLPGWVPVDEAAGAVGRAWPGATVQRTAPPTVDGPGAAVSGVRLVPDALHPDTGWLVNDLRSRAGSRRAGGADPDLSGVFASLRQAGGPVLLQVLVRPATGRRLGQLAMAGRRPVKPRRRGGRTVAVLLGLLNLAPRVLVAVVDFLTTKGASSSSRSTRPQPPDAVARDAMAEARAKRSAGPHLLATIRVGAASGRRRDARQAARSVAYGYAETSRALHPTRLTRPAAVLAQRWAGRGDWLLVTTTELGVLAHLPPDPALYRFDTAALHRTPPTGTPRAVPERRTNTLPGWNRRDGWTRPPATTAADHNTYRDSDTAHDRPERAPEIPASRTGPYHANDEDERADEEPD